MLRITCYNRTEPNVQCPGSSFQGRESSRSMLITLCSVQRTACLVPLFSRFIAQDPILMCLNPCIQCQNLSFLYLELLVQCPKFPVQCRDSSVQCPASLFSAYTPLFSAHKPCSLFSAYTPLFSAHYTCSVPIPFCSMPKIHVQWIDSLFIAHNPCSVPRIPIQCPATLFSAFAPLFSAIIPVYCLDPSVLCRESPGTPASCST